MPTEPALKTVVDFKIVGTADASASTARPSSRAGALRPRRGVDGDDATRRSSARRCSAAASSRSTRPRRRRSSGVVDVVQRPDRRGRRRRQDVGGVEGRDALKVDVGRRPARRFQLRRSSRAAARRAARTTGGYLLRREGEGTPVGPARKRSRRRTNIRSTRTRRRADELHRRRARGPRRDLGADAEPRTRASEVAAPPRHAHDDVTRQRHAARRRFGRRLGGTTRSRRVVVEGRRQAGPSPLDPSPTTCGTATSSRRRRTHAAALDEQGKLASWRHKKVSSLHDAVRPPQAEMTDPASSADAPLGRLRHPLQHPRHRDAIRAVPTHVPIGRGARCSRRRRRSPASVPRRSSRTLPARSARIPAAHARRAGRRARRRARDRAPAPSARARDRCATKSDGAAASDRQRRGVACNVYDGRTHIAYVAEVSVAKGEVRVRRVVCADRRRARSSTRSASRRRWRGADLGPLVGAQGRDHLPRRGRSSRRRTATSASCASTRRRGSRCTSCRARRRPSASASRPCLRSCRRSSTRSSPRQESESGACRSQTRISSSFSPSVAAAPRPPFRSTTSHSPAAEAAAANWTMSRFPDPRYARGDIVAIGDDLRVETLRDAYRHGIFPWPHEGCRCRGSRRGGAR